MDEEKKDADEEDGPELPFGLTGENIIKKPNP